MQHALASQLEAANLVLHANVDGLSHEDSLRSPEPGGNSLNWVVGHLVSAYNSLLGAIGGEKVWTDEQNEDYKRGSEPISADRAVAFDQLLADFGTAHGRVVERLRVLTAEELAAPAPYSPTNNPDETVGSLAGLTAFHQAYHVGQTGLLRRVCGRAGAIK
ncbi:MAG: DinB family protein [Thermoanaerobaculia bacterium]